jgi:hypothetical protein
MVDIALSKSDLLKMFDGRLNIYVYNEIKKFNTIDELLGMYGRAIILYNWEPGWGHWVSISKLDNGDIDFFDSFSSKPDHELKDIPKQFKMENGMEYPYLTKLLYESPYQIEYNDKVIQHKDSCCCGRYCAIRLSCPNLTIDEFNKLWSKDKKKNDLLSVKLTEN